MNLENGQEKIGMLDSGNIFVMIHNDRLSCQHDETRDMDQYIGCTSVMMSLRTLTNQLVN